MPDRGADCGLLMSVSVIDNVALKVPESGGVKDTSTTQLVLGFKVDWQLLVCVKVVPAGEMPMFMMLTGAVPSLYSVILWDVVVPGS